MERSVIDKLALILMFAFVCAILVTPLSDLLGVSDPGMTVLAILVGVVLAIVAASVALRGEQLRLSVMVFAGLPMALVAIISLALSNGLSFGAVMKDGFAPTSVGAMGLFSLLVVASALTSGLTLRFFARIITVAGALVAGALILAMVGLPTFSSVITHWQESEFLMLAAALASAYDQRSGAQKFDRLLNMVGGALALTGAVILFETSTVIAAVIALCVGGVYVWSREDRARARRAPLILALVLVAGVSAGLRSPFIATPITTRPSAVATESVIAQQTLSSLRAATVGEGPRAFPRAWDLYRPVSANQTAFWSLTPSYAFSGFFDIIASLGILGMVVFYSTLIVPMSFAFMRDAGGVSQAEGRVVPVVMAAYVCAYTLVYQVSPLTIIFAGISIGHMVQYGSVIRFSRRSSLALAAVTVIFSGALISVGSASIYTSVLGIRSERDVSSKSYDATIADLNRMLAISQNATVYRRLAEVYVARATIREGADQTGSQGDIARAIAAISKSADSRGLSYQDAVDDSLVLLSLKAKGVDVPLDVMDKLLHSASILSPTRPETYYLMARRQLIEDDKSAAMTSLDTALELKPDYGDAAQLKGLLSK